MMNGQFKRSIWGILISGILCSQVSAQLMLEDAQFNFGGLYLRFTSSIDQTFINQNGSIEIIHAEFPDQPTVLAPPLKDPGPVLGNHEIVLQISNEEQQNMGSLIQQFGPDLSLNMTGGLFKSPGGEQVQSESGFPVTIANSQEQRNDPDNFNLLWVFYDVNQNLLEFEFNNRLQDSHTSDNVRTIILHSNSDMLAITAVFADVSDSPDDFNYRLILDGEDAETVEAWSAFTESFTIDIPAGTFQDEFSNINNEIQGQGIDGAGEVNELRINWVHYNDQGNYLKIEFSNNLDPDAMDRGLAILIGDGNNQISLSGPYQDSDNDPMNRFFQMSVAPADANEIESWPDYRQNLTITLQPGMFTDAYGNFSPSLDAFAIDRPQQDPGQLRLHHAVIFESAEVFLMEFNNTLDINSIGSESVITIKNNDNQSIRLSPPFTYENPDGVNIRFAVRIPPSDMEALRNFIGYPHELFMDLPAQFIADTHGNFSEQQAGFGIGIHGEDSGDPGELHLGWAQYDEPGKALYMYFSNPLDDSQIAEGGTIIINDDNGNEIRIGGPFTETSEGQDDNELRIELTDIQSNTIESFINYPDEINLTLPRGIFNDQFGNPNNDINNFRLNNGIHDGFYIYWGSLQPAEGILAMGFSQDIDFTKVNSNARIKIYTTDNNPVELNTPLNVRQLTSEGEAGTAGGASPSEIQLQLTAADLEALEALNGKEYDLRIDLPEGFLISLANGEPSYPENGKNIDYHFDPFQSGDLLVVWAGYNTANGELVMEFNHDLKKSASNFNGLIKLYIEDESLGSLEINTPWRDINGDSDDRYIVIPLDDEQRMILNEMPEAGHRLKLDLPEGLFQKLGSNTYNQAVSTYPVNYGNNFQDGFSVYRIAYDPGSKALSFLFSEPIDDFKTVVPVNIPFVNQDSPGDINFIGIAGIRESNPNDHVLILELNAAAAAELEAFPNVEFDLNVSVPEGMVTSLESGEAIHSTGAHLEWAYMLTMRDLDNPGEKGIRVYYNFEDDLLMIEVNEPLDDSQTNFNGIIRISNDHGGTETITLETPWSDVSTGANDGEVAIPLSQVNADKFKQMANPNNETLFAIEAGVFSFVGSEEFNQAITFNMGVHLDFNPDGGDDPGGDGPVIFFENFRKLGQTWFEDSSQTFTLNLVLNENDTGDVKIGVVNDSLPDYIQLLSRGKKDTTYEMVFGVLPTMDHIGTHEINITIYVDKGLPFSAEMLDTEDAVLLKYTVTVNAVNDKPVITMTTASAGGAFKAALTVTDEETANSDLTVNYSLVRNGKTITPHNNDIRNPEYFPLGDGAYTFRIDVTDPDGETVTRMENFEVSGISTRVIPEGQWAMVGVLDSIMDQEGLGLTRNVATWQDESQGHNLFSKYIMNEGVGLLQRGRGYWVQLGESVTLETKAEDFQDKPFNMRLVNGGLGWNQIANPFPYSVDLTETNLEFFKWDPATSDVINVGGILEAGEAYWVNVLENRNIQIPNHPYFATGNSAKKLSGNKLLRSQVQMILTAENYQDTENFIGYSNQQTLPCHRNRLEAPKMGQHISLFFTGKNSADWYSTSFQKRDHSADSWWDFGIHNEKTGLKNARLAFSGLEQILRDKKFLFIVDKGVAREIKKGEDVHLKLTSDTRYYSIVATHNADFAESLKSGFLLNQNYPNPVRTNTNISFTLPQEWDHNGKRVGTSRFVSLDVFSMKGKKVANVLNKRFQTGTYAVKWNTHNKSGAGLPAGTYIYQLRSGKFIQSKRMIVIP